MENNLKILNHFRKNYEKIYQKEMANSLATEEKVRVVEKFLKDVVDNSDICIRVKIYDLPKILRDNRIKCTMETGTGATMGGADARKESVQVLFGFDVSELKLNEYPKYGYLACKKKMIDLVANNTMTHQYGSVIVTLKRENVFDRTTMTVGDSINFGDCFRKTPTFLDAPKINCIRDGKQTKGNMFLVVLPIPPREYYIDKFYNLIQDQQLEVDKPFQIEKVFDEMGFEFYELQIHGDIIFDRDVERVDYYADSQEAKFVEEAKILLDEMGIPFRKLGFDIQD